MAIGIFVNKSEKFAIAAVELKAPEEPGSYKETKNADKAESFSAEPIVIEGESAVRKSNRSIVSKADTSSPAMNILIKLMTIVSLVFAPVIMQYGGMVEVFMK